MTTINGKADRAHKLVKAALLFCFHLKSRRLIVLMDSSTNGDIMQVFIQKKNETAIIRELQSAILRNKRYLHQALLILRRPRTVKRLPVKRPYTLGVSEKTDTTE